jgi:hypothetical protein
LATGKATTEVFRIGYYDNQFDYKFFNDGAKLNFTFSGHLNVLGLKFETAKEYEIQVVEPQN